MNKLWKIYFNKTELDHTKQQSWEAFKEMRVNFQRLCTKTSRAKHKELASAPKNEAETAKFFKKLQGRDNRSVGILAESRNDADPSASIDILLNTHFPGSCKHDPYSEEVTTTTGWSDIQHNDLSFINIHSIKWAISTFGGNRASGLDGIKPIFFTKTANWRSKMA